MNRRPSGYEPDEIPNFSTPRASLQRFPRSYLRVINSHPHPRPAISTLTICLLPRSAREPVKGKHPGYLRSREEIPLDLLSLVPPLDSGLKWPEVNQALPFFELSMREASGRIGEDPFRAGNLIERYAGPKGPCEGYRTESAEITYAAKSRSGATCTGTKRS